ncbi:MAG TPA: class I SAM-dependent methyltransferase [Solirubrobacteraceae bacterium]|jgi:SAM-dependent methyltransferase
MPRREQATDIEMLQRLADPGGKDLVDIGCGSGALVRELTGLGARVVGVEISEQQLATALARDDGRGARYLVGAGQDLPLQTASVDVAVFMRTLHHVPAAELLTALSEARRVVRDGGLVYVAEPLTEGDFFELVSLVEDELEVRRAAQQAIDRASEVALQRALTVDYDVHVRIADLEALRARVVSVDPERAATFDGRRAEIADAFGRLGRAGDRDGERWFVAPMRADVLRPV